MHLTIKSYDLVIALTGGGPGNATELPSTFMYSYTFTRNQMAVGAASAVIMLMTIAAIIVPYLYSELRESEPWRADVLRAGTRSPIAARIVIYGLLLLFAVFYLLPLFVMVITSFKTLDEIQRRQHAGAAAARRPSSHGSPPGGRPASASPAPGIKGYFCNSHHDGRAGGRDLDAARRAQRLCADQMALSRPPLVFGLMLFACFIPFQAVLIPMALILGMLGLAGTTAGLVLVHVVYGLGFTTLFFRNYYEAFPDRADPRGADRRRRLLPDLPAHPAAVVRADHRRHGDLPVHQHLERLSVRRVLRDRRCTRR